MNSSLACLKDALEKNKEDCRLCSENVEKYKEHCLYYNANHNMVDANVVNYLAEIQSRIVNTLHSATNIAVDELLPKFTDEWYNCQSEKAKADIDPDVDTLQVCYQMLQHQLDKLLTMVNDTKEVTSNLIELNNLKMMYDCITKAQVNLVQFGLFVERQPRQVLVTNTKFQAKVRYLRHFPDSSQLAPQVRCIILSAEGLDEFETDLKGPSPSPDNFKGSAGIENSCLEWKFEENSTNRVVNFQNMLIKSKIERQRQSGPVAQQKFVLLFYTWLRFYSHNWYIFTHSLPVVVISHTNQEETAQAVMMWHYAFADFRLNSFEVPEKVTCERFTGALAKKFEVCTGRALTTYNESFIGEKLRVLSEGNEITWNDFFQFKSGHEHTFWQWFYRIIKLFQKDSTLQAMWRKGLLIGFISKRNAHMAITACDAGTVLLRFAESKLGAVSVVFKDRNHFVHMCEPWDEKFLQGFSLGSCLYSMKTQSLAETIPHVYTANGIMLLDEAFEEFYEKPRIRDDDYLPTPVGINFPSLE